MDPFQYTKINQHECETQSAPCKADFYVFCHLNVKEAPGGVVEFPKKGIEGMQHEELTEAIAHQQQHL